MLKAHRFLKLALSAIQRGGQRSIAAILTVAFGVMSLISMTSLADSIQRVIMADGRSIIGGDIQLYTDSPELDSAALAQIEDWHTQGLITAYTPLAVSFNNIALRSLEGVEIEIYGASFGIDPFSYPLLSGFVFTEGESSIGTRLQNSEGIVLTEDIAIKYGLAVGQRLRLVQLNGLGGAIEVELVGILRDTPDHSGGHVYYNLETASRLAGYEPVVTDVIALSPNLEALQSAMASTGWRGILPEEVVISRQMVRDIFDFMLKGCGILGLLVGGIGIANTMQVLLSRRQQEIAILKTLGYTQSDMIQLFVLENLLLGLVGSLLGAVLAYWLSGYMLGIFANTGTMLLHWQPDGGKFLTGIIIGLLTGFIFAFYAILKASEVRPALIFRQQTPKSQWRDWLKAAFVYSILSIPFALMTTAIFGNLLMGIGIIIIAIGGFVGLGLLLSFLIWLGLRLMPYFGNEMMGLAKKNIRKRRSSLLFGMIALFLGIYALGFASTIIDTSWNQLQARQINSQGYNVIFYGQLRDQSAFENAAHGLETQLRYIAPLVRIESSEESLRQIRQIEARETFWDIELSPAEVLENGVWLWEGFNIPPGTTISLVNLEGESHSLQVVGTYRILEQESILVASNPGLIVSPETLSEIAGESLRLEWYAETDSDTIQQIVQAVPAITARSSASIIASISASFRNLFTFAVSMSALALLAAVMLIANAVGLSMMQRRYEIGLMKALGYTQRHVLQIIAYEYALIALICSLIAVLAVQVSLILIGLANGALSGALLMKPYIALLILALGIILSLATALLSSYQTIQTKQAAGILKAE